MLKYFLKRLAAFVPVALGVILVVSSLLRVIPGDPVDSLLQGSFASENEKAELRQQLGLDQSFIVQVKNYLFCIAKGDLGESITYGQPIAELILERAVPTLELAFFSILIAILISIPLGILAARTKGEILDQLCSTVSLLGVAIPNFWLGPILILVFSVYLDIFPVSERGSWQSYILPAFTMGTALAAILTRMTRNSVLRVMGEEYIRTAKAKGNRDFDVMYKHVLKNAALPIVTIIGLQFGALLTGAIITENIFDWPGLGSLIVEALHSRDYPLIQGCILVFSFTYLIVNLATDLMYGFLDPRIKIES